MIVPKLFFLTQTYLPWFTSIFLASRKSGVFGMTEIHPRKLVLLPSERSPAPAAARSARFTVQKPGGLEVIWTKKTMDLTAMTE